MTARFAFLFLLAGPAVAQAPSATFTVKDGRPMVLGGDTALGGTLGVSGLSAGALVEGFDALCLSDPAMASGRVSDTPFGLSASAMDLPAEGKHGALRIPMWVGDSALVTLFDGHDAGWKGLRVAIPSRGGIVASAYGPFKAFGTQCNLVTKVADFAAAKAVTEALTARYGAPGKLVVNKSFADGYWQVGNVRVNVNVPTSRNGAQPLHLSAQVLPAKGNS